MSNFLMKFNGFGVTFTANILLTLHKASFCFIQSPFRYYKNLLYQIFGTTIFGILKPWTIFFNFTWSSGQLCLFFPPIKWEKIHISVSVYREQTEWHRYFWNHFSRDFQRKKILITPRIFLQHFQVKRPCYKFTNEKAWLRNNHKEFFLEKIDKKQLSSSQKLIEFHRAIKIFSRLFSFSEAAISQKKNCFFLLRSQAAIFEVWVLHTYYNIKNAAAGRGGREDVSKHKVVVAAGRGVDPNKASI